MTKYIKNLKTFYPDGKEADYYDFLAKFLEDFFPKPKFTVEVLPNGDEVVKPDITVFRASIPIICFEAKHPTADIESWLNDPKKNTDSRRLANQVYRYREDGTSPVVVTNYFKF